MQTGKKKKFHIRLGSAQLAISRTFCYIVLAFLTVLCLFSFYMLAINATRQHGAIMSGFSWLPGKSFLFNAVPHGARDAHAGSSFPLNDHDALTTAILGAVGVQH